jgi:hypothetical protein
MRRRAFSSSTASRFDTSTSSLIKFSPSESVKAGEDDKALSFGQRLLIYP